MKFILKKWKKSGSFKKVQDKISSILDKIRRLIRYANDTNVKPIKSNFENEFPSFCRILNIASNTKKQT